MNREEMENRKIELQEVEIPQKEAELENLNLDPEDYKRQYEDALDEANTVKIGGLTYSPSQVLKEVDPTAYREGLLDYIDSIDIEETNEYKEIQDEIDELQEELDDLEYRLDFLEEDDE